MIGGEIQRDSTNAADRPTSQLLDRKLESHFAAVGEEEQPIARDAESRDLRVRRRADIADTKGRDAVRLQRAAVVHEAKFRVELAYAAECRPLAQHLASNVARRHAMHGRHQRAELERRLSVARRIKVAQRDLRNQRGQLRGVISALHRHPGVDHRIANRDVLEMQLNRIRCRDILIEANAHRAKPQLIHYSVVVVRDYVSKNLRRNC